MRKPFIKEVPQEFWITNISKQAIALADLGIDIIPMTSINLLSNALPDNARTSHTTRNRRFHLQAAHSIIVRKVPPQNARKLTAFNPAEPIFDPKGSAIFSRAHSTVKVEEKHYEELAITDEQYAENEVAQEAKKDEQTGSKPNQNQIRTSMAIIRR